VADPNIRRKDLPGGLRIFSEPLAEATSVSVGLWIRAGSRDETDEVAGISHLMEHMLFKGTPDMDALGIAQAFEGIGAQENAATGEEYTVLYARFLPEHLGRALDIMSDMVLRPTLADLEREREVIVEEIKMYEDRPDQLADEYLSSLIYPQGLPQPHLHGSQHLRRRHRQARPRRRGSEGRSEAFRPSRGRAFRAGGEADNAGESLFLQVQGD
jgi:predicted Zn-dependent peptidase